MGNLKNTLQNFSPLWIRQVSSSGKTAVYKCNFTSTKKNIEKTGEILITVKNTKDGPVIDNIDVQVKSVKEVKPTPPSIILDSKDPIVSNPNIVADTGFEGWQYTGRNSEKISVDIDRIDKQIIKLKEAYQGTTVASDIDNFSLMIKNFNSIANDFVKKGLLQEAETFLNIAAETLHVAATTLQACRNGVIEGVKSLGQGTTAFVKKAYNNPSEVLADQTKKLGVILTFAVLTSQFPVVGTVGTAAYTASIGYKICKNFATKPYAQAVEDSTKLLTENALHNLIMSKGIDAFKILKTKCVEKISKLCEKNETLKQALIKDNEQILSKAFRETPLFKNYSNKIDAAIEREMTKVINQSNGSNTNNNPHMFSQQHIDNGILKVGNGENTESNKRAILDMFKKEILLALEQGVLKETDNPMRTKINGYNVEIRPFIKRGELIGFDGFIANKPPILKPGLNTLFFDPKDGKYKPYYSENVTPEKMSFTIPKGCDDQSSSSSSSLANPAKTEDPTNPKNLAAAEIKQPCTKSSIDSEIIKSPDGKKTTMIQECRKHLLRTIEQRKKTNFTNATDKEKTKAQISSTQNSSIKTTTSTSSSQEKIEPQKAVPTTTEKHNPLKKRKRSTDSEDNQSLQQPNDEETNTEKEKQDRIQALKVLQEAYEEMQEPPVAKKSKLAKLKDFAVNTLKFFGNVGKKLLGDKQFFKAILVGPEDAEQKQQHPQNPKLDQFLGGDDTKVEKVLMGRDDAKLDMLMGGGTLDELTHSSESQPQLPFLLPVPPPTSSPQSTSMNIDEGNAGINQPFASCSTTSSSSSSFDPNKLF